MLIPKHRLETSIETHTSPLLIEGRFEVPSKKRGFRGISVNLRSYFSLNAIKYRISNKKCRIIKFFSFEIQYSLFDTCPRENGDSIFHS